VRCACIDIGSNATRLVVADCRNGALGEVLRQRESNRLGRGLRRDGHIAPDKVADATC